MFPVAQGLARAVSAAWRLANVRPVRWVRVLYRYVARSRSLDLAAQVAFWFFLSLIPLAAVVGMLAVKVTLRSHGSLAPLLDPLPGSIRAFMRQELRQVAAWQGGTVGPVASAVFVWLASSGVHAVIDALERATGARPRPWWNKRLRSIACCLCLSAGVALITEVGLGIDWLARITHGGVALGPSTDGFERAWRVALAIGVSLGLVSGLYKVGIPAPTLRRMPILPGAALAVALQFLLGYGYRLYIGQLGDGSAYLASLATIGVTMMTLYLMSIALLVGVEHNELLGVTRAVSRTRKPRRASGAGGSQST